jgi:hypothetical protein
MEERNPDHGAPQEPVKAIRLIFEYEGDKVTLISQQPVEIALPDTGISTVEHSAYYVDTRDVAGRTLSRVKAHGAFASSAEVFPEHPGDPISRVELKDRKGAFTVITHAADDADNVAVLKSPARPIAVAGAQVAEADAAPSHLTEIASFSLSGDSKSKKEEGNQ